MATESSTERLIDIFFIPSALSQKQRSLPFQADPTKGSFEMDTRKPPECVKASCYKTKKPQRSI